MTRYRLRLSITYSFGQPTGAGRQLLRICPADLPGVQRVVACTVSVTPRPAERRDFRDFFGTGVIEVVLNPGQTEARFDMVAEVQREEAAGGFDLSAPLARLGRDLAAITDLGAESPHHFLAPSPRIPADDAIALFAAGAVTGASTARAAVERLGRAIHATMAFDARATVVDTPIAVAFAGRRGVCQDFSQIMVGGLRSLGIPAAYVTGFLRTRPPAGKPRLEGADAMHAWVRAWTGTEAGWVEYDPTNACFVGADHVTVGYGRDYSDAAPVTGSLRLGGGQAGTHSVDIVAL